MSDDLIKRLRGWDHCWPARWLEGDVAKAADRIEQLERDLGLADNQGREWEYHCKNAEAKLAKAVEALPKLHAVLDILLNNFPTKTRPEWVADTEQHIDAVIAVLAELEGGE
jgi:hypothetical protein